MFLQVSTINLLLNINFVMGSSSDMRLPRRQRHEY